MNTQISVINAAKNSDNLLVLADRKNLDWISRYLNTGEIYFFKKAVKTKIASIFFPQQERMIVVQFLKSSPTTIQNKEETRVAGNEILNTLSHYKMAKITLINFCQDNRALFYLEGMVLGNYQFLKYFKEKKDRTNILQEIKVVKNAASKKSIDELKIVLEATCKARDLVNEPYSYLTTERLSEEIKTIGKESGFKVKVLDEKEIEALGMGGILAVNRGSFTPPRFNIMEWKPAKPKNKKPIVLVGKGIVYDTGGLSLKPTLNSMDKMKCDMAGAATVIGAMAAVAKAKLPIHLVALVPSTENRPGNNAYVPGDVITMHSGTTVEVLNTDAEGRLVLADALHYAKQYHPELVMDFATLTGSAANACGKEAICYMGNADKSTKTKIEESGFNVYERLIEFPLWKEYGEQLKSNIADLKNIGGPTAGMITAGKFLEHFTDYPWLHFDIAGPAYLKSADAYRSKEGTGVGVRLLFYFLKNNI